MGIGYKKNEKCQFFLLGDNTHIQIYYKLEIQGASRPSF